jgi:hypothetical protein
MASSTVVAVPIKTVLQCQGLNRLRRQQAEANTERGRRSFENGRELILERAGG